MKKKNKAKDIRDALLRGESLTVLIAIQKYHTTELRKEISRLRDRGWRICKRTAYFEEDEFDEYFLAPSEIEAHKELAKTIRD